MAGGKLKVKNVYSCFDCGQYVNLDAVENQIQGSVNFGLSLALYGNITAKDGTNRTKQF